MRKNQSGFTVIEVLLAVITVAVIGFGIYYVYSQNNKKAETNIDSQNQTQSQSEIEISQNEETQTESKDGYTIDLEEGRKSTVKEVSFADFELSNKGGSALIFNASTQKFLVADIIGSGQLDTANARVLKRYAKAGDVDIYLWGDGDAGWLNDTYLIVLNNDKILQVSFDYYYEQDDGYEAPQEEMTQAEIDAQKVKDFDSVITFKFN